MSGLRILQLWELVQNICHLISTLSASDVDNDIRLSPLCKLMLDNCFAASERSGNRSHSSLCYREECIYNSLSCDKWHDRWYLFLIWTALTNRPLLHECQLPVTLVCLNHTHSLLNCEFSCLYLFDGSCHTIRHHDLLCDDHSLLNCSYHIACRHLITHLGSRHKCPLDISLQRWDFNSSLQVVTTYLHDIIQRSLDSIVYTAYKSRSQLNRQRHSR